MLLRSETFFSQKKRKKVVASKEKKELKKPDPSGATVLDELFVVSMSRLLSLEKKGAGVAEVS